MLYCYRYFFVAALTVFSGAMANAQAKKFAVHTIAFYNVENLYDTVNDPHVNDDEFLSQGLQSWTAAKYANKLSNLATVIAGLGTAENPNCPTILGLAEIENRMVVQDLLNQPQLAGKDYGIIHFDSPDRRGIDVALLYQKKHFKPTSYKNIPLYIFRDTKTNEQEASTADEGDEAAGVVITANYGSRVYTRDQLLVTGMLDGEEISFIVNHWPSRSGGEKKSSPYREAAAALNIKIIDSLYKINPDAKIISMGDFNDGPYNKSIKQVLGAKAHKDQVKHGGLYNPMEEMGRKGMATVAYRDAWDIFDQMLLSKALIEKDYATYRFWKAAVYNKTFMMQASGQYKGYPLRNANGEAGISDHFPVYLYLIKQVTD